MAIAKMEEAAVQQARRNIETELETQHAEAFEQKFRDEAFEFRGRLLAVTSISRTLNSKLIEGYMVVEEKKYWRVWGHQSFAHYLNSDEVPEFSKTQYYELKKLLQSEGPALFDFFSDRKIAAATRRLLSANNTAIEIDGDIVRIGDFEAPASDRKAIVQICEAYSGALQQLRDDNEKLMKVRETDREKIQRGTDENEQLRRALDAREDTPRFQRAITAMVQSMLNLTEAVGELDDDEKRKRGPEDLQLVAELYFRLSDAYGLKRSLAKRPAGGDPVADRVIAEMIDDGSFEDLD